MQKLVTATPELAARREFREIMNLKTTDCIATRLWFDRPVPCRFPANVLGGFEPDCGHTFFDLTQLQVGVGGRQRGPRGGGSLPTHPPTGIKPRPLTLTLNPNQFQDEYRDAPGAVIAADFYHSNALMPLTDAEIVARVHANIAACEPGFADAKVRGGRGQSWRGRLVGSPASCGHMAPWVC